MTMLRVALKEFLNHSKASRGGVLAQASKHESKQASKQAVKQASKACFKKRNGILINVAMSITMSD